ncbi:MAG TPA: hypothetical protein VKB02_11405, partial [Pyrinomonadaceae bacterium]|nr:hypothetical protein [Pyrinomonadaceae bacterium]
RPLSDLSFYCDHFRDDGCHWWFEMYLDRLRKITKRFFFTTSLACEFKLSTLSDIPVALSPY